MMKKIFNIAALCMLLAACAGPAMAASGPSSGVVEKLFVQKGAGAVPRTMQDKLGERIDVADFLTVAEIADATSGIEPVIDVTAKVQKALDQGYAAKKVVYGGSLALRTSGPLVMNGPGLEFSGCSYGAVGNFGIYATGSGYTALTVARGAQAMQVTVYGTGNAINGILMENPILSNVECLRVYRVDGYGVKINNTWDSVYRSISIERAGNASEYAFSLNDGGAESNMTQILRLQVEQANVKAIYISPNTLSTVINAIHSEGAWPVPGVMTWVLGGNRSLYNAARLSANNPADATAFIVGGNLTITNLLTEYGMKVVFDGSNGNNITLVTPEISGPLKENPGQYGTLSVYGGGMSVAPEGRTRMYGVKVAGKYLGADVEEGAWVPVVSVGGTQVPATNVEARYQRIGNMVHFVAGGVLPATALSGTVSVSGLPFPIDPGGRSVTQFSALPSDAFGGIASMPLGLGIPAGGSNVKGFSIYNYVPGSGTVIRNGIVAGTYYVSGSYMTAR